jgi:hypothetical protein
MGHARFGGILVAHHNNPDKLELYSSANAKNKLSSNRISAYIQDTYQIPVSSGSLYFNGGIRTQYWDYSGQTVISRAFRSAISRRKPQRFEVIFPAEYMPNQPFIKNLKIWMAS